MIKWSFYSKDYCNCTKDEMIEFVKTTTKPFKYTYGLGYRNPTTNHVPITQEQAIKYATGNGMTDVQEYEDYVHINQYSDNDMW